MAITVGFGGIEIVKL